MVCKAEQRRMRKKVQQALQPTNGTTMDKQQTDDIIDSYMARNTENYDVETLIPVSQKCSCLDQNIHCTMILITKSIVHQAADRKKN